MLRLILKHISENPHKNRTSLGNPVSLCRIGWELAQGSETILRKDTAQGLHKGSPRLPQGVRHAMVHVPLIGPRHPQGVHTARSRTHTSTLRPAPAFRNFWDRRRKGHLTCPAQKTSRTRNRRKGPCTRPHTNSPHKEICTKTFLDISSCAFCK